MPSHAHTASHARARAAAQRSQPSTRLVQLPLQRVPLLLHVPLHGALPRPEALLREPVFLSRRGQASGGPAPSASGRILHWRRSSPRRLLLLLLPRRLLRQWHAGRRTGGSRACHRAWGCPRCAAGLPLQGLQCSCRCGIDRARLDRLKRHAGSWRAHGGAAPACTAALALVGPTAGSSGAVGDAWDTGECARKRPSTLTRR